MEGEWKRLGFGCMRLPQQQDGRIDRVQFRAMVDAFLQAGYRYFDTAYPYHNGESESAVGSELVARYPRDAFLLADKMPVRLCHTKEDYRRIWNTQLERTGCSYFDYYLMHALNRERYEKALALDGFSFVKRLKEEGRIRHLGISFHDTAEVLDRILTEHPEIEFVQIQLNYLDWDDPKVQSRLCYETILRHGRKVWVMEPVKGGMLANLPPKAEAMLPGPGSAASWGYRFVAGLDVTMILGGMHDLAQVRENVATFDRLQPVGEAERKRLAEIAAYLHQAVSIGCTSCRYCVAGCPRGIDIPAIFQIYNQDALFPNLHERFARSYASQQHHPDACIRCGKCAKTCPQHLPIPDLWPQIIAAFPKA